MNKIKQKLLKIGSLVKIRNRELLLSRNDLYKIQSKKKTMIECLNKSQQTYMQSVDSLNHLRSVQANDSETLPIEASLEYVRNKWATELSEVRKLERQERVQMAIVQEKEAKLKAVEKIGDKYSEELVKERNRQEQVSLDEFVAAKYKN